MGPIDDDSSVLVNGTLLHGGKQAYSLELLAGQAVMVRVVDTGHDSFLPGLEAFDPTGKAAVNATYGADVAALSFSAKQSGTYSVVVSDKSSPSATFQGSYSLYVSTAPGATEGGLLPVGGVVSGSFDEGDLDSYTFSASAGEAVARITERGYAREQDLEAKLTALLHDVGYLNR